MKTTRLAHLIAGFAAILALFGVVGTAGFAQRSRRRRPSRVIRSTHGRTSPQAEPS